MTARCEGRKRRSEKLSTLKQREDGKRVCSLSEGEIGVELRGRAFPIGTEKKKRRKGTLRLIKKKRGGGSARWGQSSTESLSTQKMTEKPQVVPSEEIRKM